MIGNLIKLYSTNKLLDKSLVLHQTIFYGVTIQIYKLYLKYEGSTYGF